jgi:fructokinase
MRPEDVAFDVIDGHDIFHYGSITLIDEPVRSATLGAVNYARTQGKTISYDPNLRLSLWRDEASARAGLLSGLEYAHIVKVSDEELEFLTGGHDPAPLWREGMRMVVVTHGANGATLYTRSEAISVEGFHVNAVDTTGAGDGFVAGLLVSLLEQGMDDLRESLRFACAVGAMTTTARGAIPALPTRAQVEKFLQDNT